jgi:hypothetical protein
MIDSFDVPKVGRREWIGLAVIALPCLLYSMDLEVRHLALHTSAQNSGPPLETEGMKSRSKQP